MTPLYLDECVRLYILTPENKLYRIASEYVSLIHQDSDGSENWALVSTLCSDSLNYNLNR